MNVFFVVRGRQQLQLVAQPPAEVRAFVREAMLEELFPGEILEIRVLDTAQFRVARLSHLCVPEKLIRIGEMTEKSWNIATLSQHDNPLERCAGLFYGRAGMFDQTAPPW